MVCPAPAPAPQLRGRRWIGSRSALGACLALLAAGALWMVLRPGAEVNRPAHPVVVFVPGQRLVYHLEFAGASAADFSALFDSGPSALSHAFEAALQGELTVT